MHSQRYGSVKKSWVGNDHFGAITPGLFISQYELKLSQADFYHYFSLQFQVCTKKNDNFFR